MRKLVLCCVAMLAATASALASGYENFNAGLVASQRGDVKEAIDNLTRAIAAPDFPEHLRASAYLARGEDYARASEYASAVADFTDALKLEPDDLQILLDRAEAYDRLRHYTQALADEAAAIRLRPYYPASYYERMDTNAALGRPADEIADCNTLLSSWPEDKAFILARRGDAYLRMGQYAQAEGDADAAIEANGQFALGYLVRGRARALQDALDGARDDFDTAVNRDKSNVYALRARGLVAWDLDNYDRAADDFRAALKLDAGDGIAALGLQIAKFKTGAAVDGELAAAAARLDLKVWPGPLIAFYLGRLDERGLNAAATDDSAFAAARDCQTAFYVGEWKLAHADTAPGTGLMQKAASDCAPDVLERESARVELRHLQAVASRP